LADILQALSVGQGLTSTGRGFARTQSWQNALEKAHVNNEWIMQARDFETSRHGESLPRSLDLRQPDIKSRSESAERRPEAPARQRSAIDHAATARHSLKFTVNRGAGGSIGNLVPGQGYSSTPVTTAPPRSVAPAKQAAPPTPTNPPSANPGPRSVHLITVSGGVQVVIRDEALKGPQLPKLVSRVRELIAGFGEQVNKITVNGHQVWTDPATPVGSAGADPQATIEILF
jgi:hypothetical protein